MPIRQDSNQFDQPKKNPLSRKLIGNEQGNAFLEFALVLPWIFIIFAYTVEFTRVFRVKELMSLASREASHLAFRECFDTRRSMCNLGSGDSKVDLCLNYYGGEITNTVAKSLPDITLSLSLYAFDSTDPLDPTLGNVELIGYTFDPNVGTLGNRTPTDSRFDETIVNARYRNIIIEQQVLVFAEVYYTFGQDQYLVNAPFLPTLEMYDVTVF